MTPTGRTAGKCPPAPWSLPSLNSSSSFFFFFVIPRHLGTLLKTTSSLASDGEPRFQLATAALKLFSLSGYVPAENRRHSFLGPLEFGRGCSPQIVLFGQGDEGKAYKPAWMLPPSSQLPQRGRAAAEGLPTSTQPPRSLPARRSSTLSTRTPGSIHLSIYPTFLASQCGNLRQDLAKNKTLKRPLNHRTTRHRRGNNKVPGPCSLGGGRC